MSIQKVEMTVEQKENGQYVEQVAYPYVEYEHVTMENGMDIMSMIRDDVSTPMVTHNTTSWKVGQGDSDVSESIVDSSVGDMAIKGQTYQNILPSPSLRNSMTNGKTMQKLNEGYDSVNTVNGVCKSAILKGQTLVNLIVDKSDYENKSGDININIIGNTVKTNTNYTLLFDIDGDTSSTFAYGFLKGSQWLNGFLTTNVGKSKILINTGNTTIDDTIKLRLRTSQSVVRRLVLLEGDYTNVDIPYFEGMQSVKMPVLTTHNGNIMRMNPTKKWSNNNQNGCTMEEISPTDFIFTNKLRQQYAGFGFSIPLKEKFTVAFDYEKISGCNKYCQFHVFNGGGIPSATNLTEQKGSVVSTYTVGRNTPVEIYFKPCGELESEDSILKITNLRWYIGDKVYEDKTNILSVNEEVELRGIGDVKDTLDLTTGELTERIGEFIVHCKLGVEGCLRFGTTDIRDDYIRMVCTNTFGKVKKNSKFLNNKFDTVSCMAEDYIYIFVRGELRDRIYADAPAQIAQNFMDLLNEWHDNDKPLIIQYEKKSEQNKTISLSILDQDNQPIKQLNSFANGYIQVSSQEGTLIPTTEYEVPTSNSYHVDLMKANTKYTMKNMQGTFTIDNIQYNASANGTFTSPNTLTNKFMVTNVAQTQPMLLEGDMTSKEVPYVEGIKSAFDGADRVEIYSVGKNLFNKKNHSWDLKIGHVASNGKISSVYKHTIYTQILDVPKNMQIISVANNLRTPIISYYDKNDSFVKQTSDGIIDTSYERMRLSFRTVDNSEMSEEILLNSNIQIEEGTQATTYEPYKSNTTSFQLPHSLRSLPNGVRDEIVLDRQNHKARIVQRVGSVVLDGSFGVPSQTLGDYFISYYAVSDVKKVNGGNVYCDKFKSHGQIWVGGQEGVSTFSNSTIWLSIYSKKLEASNIDGMKKWLSQNPTTVYYELASPIITQVDIEGFPYVYKDGHIFLNTEVAPTTEVKYSINQSQIIESQSEDIVRHSKEIDNLYNLIATYVQVNYDSTLLNLKIKGV